MTAIVNIPFCLSKSHGMMRTTRVYCYLPLLAFPGPQLTLIFFLFDCATWDRNSQFRRNIDWWRERGQGWRSSVRWTLFSQLCQLLLIYSITSLFCFFWEGGNSMPIITPFSHIRRIRWQRAWATGTWVVHAFFYCPIDNVKGRE